MALELTPHPDGRHRCSWCGKGAAFTDYVAYHDTEWGLPEGRDVRLFEKICLEGFQAGLSWITVLRKREHFREVFHGFEPQRMVRMGPADVERLVLDAGIIRHRGKIESALNNAGRLLAMWGETGEGALARLVWAHEPTAAQRPAQISPDVAVSLTQTAQSLALSKALKKLGWSFVGPTTMYAFMQSMGVVNDHLEGCSARPQVEAARTAFKRPA